MIISIPLMLPIMKPKKFQVRFKKEHVEVLLFTLRVSLKASPSRTEVMNPENKSF